MRLMNGVRAVQEIELPAAGAWEVHLLTLHSIQLHDYWGSLGEELCPSELSHDERWFN